MKHKVCKMCLTDKPLREYHPFKDMKDGYINICKDCQNRRTKVNKALRGKDYNNAKSRAYRTTNRERIKGYYGGQLTCEHCGLQDEFFGAYDFHHIDPSSKEKRIGILINGGWDKIKRELEKCLVLCVICHRKEHHRIANEVNKET